MCAVGFTDQQDDEIIVYGMQQTVTPVTIIDPITGQPISVIPTPASNSYRFFPGAFGGFGTNLTTSDTHVGSLIVSADGVPEPASWAMMILGMGAVGYVLRCKVRASEVRFNTRIKRIAAGA